ncbi:hypothetical protein QO179_00475 [Bacillus stercoris]|nr:hypothetical protein [Bacillus stercoris]
MQKRRNQNIRTASKRNHCTNGLALDVLLTYENPEHPSVVKGMHYLTDSSSYSADNLAYPAGIGLPKQFYIRYHSYPYVFSLLAVGKYFDSIEKEIANET